jgi:methyltransferase (TIGR00027 family)
MTNIGVSLASRTAEITAAMRAGETRMPHRSRLFVDPFARRFVSDRMLRLATSRPLSRVALWVFDRIYGGMNIQHHLRHRFYETHLDAAHVAGVRQVVMVGAGYDSLALRRAYAGTTVYEVDAPSTQARKVEHVRAIGAPSATPVVYVPCNFETDDLRERLLNAGLDADAPTFFVWMGVSYYLTAEGARTTLAALRSLAAPGSRLAFDYMDPSVIEGSTSIPGARRAAAAVARRGEPYVLGFDDAGVTAFAEDAGWTVAERLRVTELIQRLVPRGRVWCRTDDYMGVVLATA